MLDPVTIYRVSRWAYVHRLGVAARLLTKLSGLMFHCYLPHTAEIGRGFEVGYGGCGVVVHGRARLGANVFMGPGAIIGGRSQRPGVPEIGSNVYIAPGAKVLGEITIGNDVVIGANAVVIESVPDNCIVAGIPAKIIRRNITSYDYTGWPPQERDKGRFSTQKLGSKQPIEELDAHIRDD